ncbi:hypothetical protein ES702_07049 [subsurface metagenome]
MIGLQKTRARLRALQSRVEDTVYQAAEDGFFIGEITISVGAGAGRIHCRIDDVDPPLEGSGYTFVELIDGTYINASHFCMPVKRGMYYRGMYLLVFGTPTITRDFYWQPFK